MVDVNTIVGDAMETGHRRDDHPHLPGELRALWPGAASTALDSPIPSPAAPARGVSIRPVGFLVVAGERVRMLPIDYANL